MELFTGRSVGEELALKGADNEESGQLSRFMSVAQFRPRPDELQELEEFQE